MGGDRGQGQFGWVGVGGMASEVILLTQRRLEAIPELR